MIPKKFSRTYAKVRYGSGLPQKREPSFRVTGNVERHLAESARNAGVLKRVSKQPPRR